MIRPTRRGFTLIELLVVVTIIVVLLALLTPALDKAIYQAELAVCGTKLHTIAAGAISYAFDQKRHYPDRPARRSSGSNRPVDLYYGFNQLRHLDDRLILRQFISLNKTLNCPLIKPTDIENSEVDSAVLSNYALYFGFQYIIPNRQVEQGMLRPGDRLTHTEAGDGSKPPVTNTFNVLASDWDGIYTNDNQTIATHPDLGGAMIPYYVQDGNYANGEAPAIAPLKATFSVWWAIERPPIDTNYAFDDGSVARFNNVKYDEGAPGGDEERFVYAPQTDVDNQPNWKMRLPRR